MEIFSPTQTVRWNRCALLNSLTREGWEPRNPTNSLLGRIAGGTFADGAAVLHRLVQAGLAPNDPGVVSATMAACSGSLNSTFTRYQEAGIRLTDEHYEDLKRDCLKGVEKYATYQPFPFRPECIVDVERELGGYGKCRLDVIERGQDGLIYPVELKYKRLLRTDYIQSTINEFLQSWQFLHYSYALTKTEQYGNTASKCGLILVIMSPRFTVIKTEVQFTPETLAMFEQSAKVYWADMAAEKAGIRPITMATNHKDQYGLCHMYKACFDYHLDEGLMEYDYVRIPHETEEVR